MTKKEARIKLIAKREELMHKYMFEEAEVLTVAIEALKREDTDEWCTDCKEYDTEKKCCPRFNKVIRGAVADALDAIPSADRRKGHWINKHENVNGRIFRGDRCSECGWWKSMGAYNFCPNCGSDNRKRREDE